MDREWARVAGAPADGLGNALAPAGDVNGDGAEDLLVAAYLGNRVCVLLGGVPDGESTLDALSPACLAGEGPHDYAGYALAGVGDADGDGFDDVMVGSIGNSEAGSNAGKAYLVRGPLAPGSTSLADATASWLGEAEGDYAGVGLARAGDPTGDGAPDFLIGASGYDAAGTAGGRAYLIPGPVQPGAWSLAEASISFTGLTTTPEAAPPPHAAFGIGDFVGDSLVGPGDLDGDGVDDLALSAPGDATLGANTGRVCIFHGPVGEGAHSITEADLVVQGVASGSFTGSPLAAPGDLSGDGLADLIVGADGSGTGFVYLLAAAGSTGSIPVDSAWGRLDGEVEGDFFGFAISAADVTGDGLTDVLVGAPNSDRGGTYSGAAYLFAGPFAAGATPASAASALHGEIDVGSFGSAVAAGADLNHDGVPDLAVGEYLSAAGGGFSGAVYLIAP